MLRRSSQAKFRGVMRTMVVWHSRGMRNGAKGSSCGGWWNSGRLNRGRAMAGCVRAVFEQGNFVPETPCDPPEGTRVPPTVHAGAGVPPPKAGTPAERARILRGIVERMQRNPLPATARRLLANAHHRGHRIKPSCQSLTVTFAGRARRDLSVRPNERLNL